MSWSWWIKNEEMQSLLLGGGGWAQSQPGLTVHSGVHIEARGPEGSSPLCEQR